MPARISSDHVQVGLRIREGLRTRLEREAQKNKVPLNREMMNRLERSFDVDAARSINDVASDLASTWARVRKSVNA